MSEKQAGPPGAAFRVGDWHVDPGSGRIKSGSLESKLEPKVMEVLVCLAQQPGEVVSREQLEATVWAGMVVGYDSLASTIIKLRKAFGDDSRQPKIIETVPKRGYRLIAEVSHTPPAAAAEAAAPAPVEAVAERFPPAQFTWLLLGGAAIAMLLGITAWLYLAAPPSEEALEASGRQRPSVAVLPFKNISDDPDQEYFSDGITADLITDLSQLSSLSVIARNSVFAYRKADVDVRRVGHELDVDYVVEGSVRRAGDTVRISARLTDTGNAHTLWAERFDSALQDVFVLQDRVSAKIVAALQLELTEHERRQLVHDYTDSIEAYDEFLRGWKSFWEFSEAGNRGAKAHFEKAIELDADFARAYANLAIAYAYESMNGWSDDRQASLEKARGYARRAVALDTRLPQVYWAMGLIEMFSKDYRHALETAEQSIALDPNYADGYGLLATILNYAGRPQQALEVMQKAMRLNPRYPFAYRVIRGEIYFNQRDYSNAVSDFLYALERNPEAYEPRLWLAAAYAHLGRIDDAQWEVEQIRNSGQQVSLEHIESAIPLNDPVQVKHLVDGLGAAGIR